MAASNATPRSTQSWLTPLYNFLDFLLGLLSLGSQRHYFIDVATLKPLAANTYANGSSGVGATLTFNATGVQTVDGVTLKKGMLVLVGGEATGANNGVYLVTTAPAVGVAGVLTRMSGFDSAAAMKPGVLFSTRSGSSWANKTFIHATSGTITVGSTALIFAAQPKLVANRGVIPGSRVAFSVNPTAGNTIGIGSITFQFVASLGAATANVQVLIGGTAAATLANMIAAVNGDTTNANWVEATTPFASKVVADAVTATVLRLRLADARGGNPVAGVSASLALTATITGGASAWNIANLNASGKADTDVLEASGAITITAAMITAASVNVELPFAASIFQVQVMSSTGAMRSTTDLITLQDSGTSIKIALAGGASPAIQANDVVSFWVQQ